MERSLNRRAGADVATAEDNITATAAEASAQRNVVHELRRPEPETQPPPAPGEPSVNAEQPQPAPESTEPPSPTRKWTRLAMFAALPAALLIGGYIYVTGGQVMSTDNAYVQADRVGVSTDVAGTVIAVEVHDNEIVKQGAVLYRLRPDTFQTALDGAKAQLGAVHDQIATLHASYQLALAQNQQASAELPFYQTAFERQKQLLATGAGTKAAYDSAQHDLQAAQQKLDVAQAQAATTLAQLGGDPNQPAESNSLYLQAKSNVDNAQRDLNDTIVKAPFDGIVTNVSAIQVGSYLQASQQAFSLVATSHMWIEASPKETELTYVRPGQIATISVDTYPGVEWKGVVDSISPASSSTFSLLPAQNTTGNWVKVVQRIPMRVRIDDPTGKPPLRVGMSVTVEVDTGHARGLPEFITGLFGRSGKTNG